ncbi:MAG: RluA family pseudouridine synthase [Lachnospiraceae bacterium]|nr:RluA family pseudouridine synthase [Lachnospiraceae bacterium]
MERTFVYTISHKEHDTPIGLYLKSMGFSASNLTALKKMPESILVNGRWEYMTYRLSEGDTLLVRLSETSGSPHIVPVPLPLSIVYEDEDILIVSKAADTPIHPSQNNYTNTLANAVMYHYSSQGIPFTFRCINRLDRDTTGLTIIAKHMISAGILSRSLAKRSSLSREYMALVPRFSVCGAQLPDAGVIREPIGRKPGSTIERFVDPMRGENAVTHYRKLWQNEDTALLSLRLETGRTHQIRVHMAYAGHPLLGDSLYGGDLQKIRRQALHSCRLSFHHPFTKESLTFTAPLPEDMKRLIL